MNIACGHSLQFAVADMTHVCYQRAIKEMNLYLFDMSNSENNFKKKIRMIIFLRYSSTILQV